MKLVLAIFVGLLFSASLYLMLRKSFFKLILGVIIFSYATNFFLFLISGVTRDNPPLLEGKTFDPAVIADPLPQALTLTAIVIGIGIQVFIISLSIKFFKKSGINNPHELDTTDKLNP